MSWRAKYPVYTVYIQNTLNIEEHYAMCLPPEHGLDLPSRDALAKKVKRLVTVGLPFQGKKGMKEFFRDQNMEIDTRAREKKAWDCYNRLRQKSRLPNTYSSISRFAAIYPIHSTLERDDVFIVLHEAHDGKSGRIFIVFTTRSFLKNVRRRADIGASCVNIDTTYKLDKSQVPMGVISTSDGACHARPIAFALMKG
eukprot:Selendium_serpulae@DN4717_c0_g2_i1.p1